MLKSGQKKKKDPNKHFSKEDLPMANKSEKMLTVPCQEGTTS